MVLIMGIGISTILQVVPLFVKYIILACSMIFFYIAVNKVLEEQKFANKNNGEFDNHDNTAG